MYYIGTKTQCESYNKKVTAASKFDGVYTKVWANIVQSHKGEDFAVIKHPDYKADMKEVDTLPADWFLIEEA